MHCIEECMSLWNPAKKAHFLGQSPKTKVWVGGLLGGWGYQKPKLFEKKIQITVFFYRIFYHFIRLVGWVHKLRTLSWEICLFLQGPLLAVFVSYLRDYRWESRRLEKYEKVWCSPGGPLMCQGPSDDKWKLSAPSFFHKLRILSRPQPAGGRHTKEYTWSK